MSSQSAFEHWKGYALCERLDVAMLSCHLCMDGRLLRNHSLALNQAAHLLCAQSTEIVIWRLEFIVVECERLSAILPKNDTRDSGRCNGAMGTRTIAGRLSGWNLRRCLLEYEMHLSEDYFWMRYSSFHLLRHA